jgi:hypothetical protein
MEVVAPFLERTRDKLRERARAIIERCPELEYYFEDPTFRDIASRVDPAISTCPTPKCRGIRIN